jgi:hypothetical protein
MFEEEKAELDKFNKESERLLRERWLEYDLHGLVPSMKTDDGIFLNVNILDDVTDSLNFSIAMLVEAGAKKEVIMGLSKVSGLYRTLTYVAAGKPVPSLLDQEEE